MPCPNKSILLSVDASGKQAFVIQQFYCIPLAKLGKCTQVCSSCQDNLDAIFKNARSVKEPRHFDAVLTYMARERIAEIEEESEARKEFPRNRWGEIDERNPFDLFLERL